MKKSTVLIEYVNDIVITGDNEEEISELKKHLAKNLRWRTWFLEVVSWNGSS